MLFYRTIKTKSTLHRHNGFEIQTFFTWLSQKMALLSHLDRFYQDSVCPEQNPNFFPRKSGQIRLKLFYQNS